MSDLALLNPDILRLILRMLRWDDLDKCRQVCETWRDEVDVLRNFRPPVMLVIEQKYGIPTTKSDGVLREQPLVSITFENSQLMKEPNYSLFVVVGSFMVIATDVFHRVRLGVIERPMKCGFTIPTIEGVKVSTFKFKEISSSPEEYYDRRWKKINRIIKDNFVKCVLIFAKPDRFSYYSARSRLCHMPSYILSYISRKQPEEPEIATGGGVFKDIIDITYKKYDNINLVLFNVPKTCCIINNFRAFSHIFQGSIFEPRELEDEFKLLSERISLLKYSIALKFSGKNRPEVEDELFIKYFPKTPIVGTQCIAEYGTFCYSASDKPSEKRNKADFGRIYRTNITSLVILTWN